MAHSLTGNSGIPEKKMGRKEMAMSLRHRYVRRGTIYGFRVGQQVNICVQKYVTPLMNV